jgi:hypothetical protein
MSFRAMADTKKKTPNTSASSVSIIPPYHNKSSQSIGNKQKTEESIVHNALASSGLSHAFKQIRVHAPTKGSLNNQAMQSCPMTSTPRACPFGGACHICPAKIQTKLAINRPGDQYEQEADRIAEQITDMSEPKVFLQTSDSDISQSSAVPPIVYEVLSSLGQPLEAGTRTFMESRFGHDFSNVRVHTDSKAAESTESVNALAYTAGKDIVFGKKQYAPKTDNGKRMLAHELTHVIQQGNAQGALTAQPRLVQRSLDTYIKAMNQDPPNWYTAALHLNGESQKMIRQMLKNLGDPQRIAKLHRAALDGKGLGPCSNIALLTEHDYLKMNPGEKPIDRTKCERPSTPESKKAAKETVEVQIVSSDKELMETLPEYIDGKVYMVGVRLLDRTYHLFIHGRERPLTIPAAWFGQQTEPVSAKFIYPSRERALEMIGSSASGYAYWRTDENYILPTHFTQSSSPRINTLALGSLEEAAKYGKEIFTNVFVGMVIGKSIEAGFKGLGYVVSKTLRRLETPPLKPRTGRKAPIEGQAAPQAPKAGQEGTEGRGKVVPIEEGQRIRERKAAKATEVPEEPELALASGDRPRASSTRGGKKGGSKTVSGGEVEGEVNIPREGEANVPPEKPPVKAEPRARGSAIETRHLDSMPEYTRAKEHNFPGIEGWKGGKEVMRDTKSGRVRSIYGADVIQIKSMGNSNPKTIQARGQEGIRGLETDIFAAGNTRIVNPKGRRLDMIFDEGALTDVTPEIRKLLTDLTKSAGDKGIEMRWFRYTADRKVPIGIP